MAIKIGKAGLYVMCDKCGMIFSYKNVGLIYGLNELPTFILDLNKEGWRIKDNSQKAFDNAVDRFKFQNRQINYSQFCIQDIDIICPNHKWKEDRKWIEKWKIKKQW